MLAAIEYRGIVIILRFPGQAGTIFAIMVNSMTLKTPQGGSLAQKSLAKLPIQFKMGKVRLKIVW
jgi:hypothetical protein